MPDHRQLLAHVLLLFNLYMGPTVVGASWTLPIEVQMYIALPFLFFFVRGARKMWPLLVLSGFVILWDRVSYPAEFSNLLMCIPYFIPGVIAYQLRKEVRPRLASWLFPVFVAVLVGVGYHHANYRGAWILCTVLGLSLPHFKQMTWRPVLVASHLVSRYSYGIYLCHFIAIAVGSYYLAKYSLGVRAMGYVVTIVVMPVALYHLLEEPMIRLGTYVAKRVEAGRSAPVTDASLNLEPAP